MSLPQHRAVAGLAAIASLAVSLWAAPAVACGGCFNMVPPPPPKPGEPVISSPVVQDAERVLFLRDEVTKVSHVWVEVRYTGLAKDFGWVLPVPKLPKVGVGTTLLFDHLDGYTRPRYFLSYQGQENCNDPYMGCEPVVNNWADASSVKDAASDASTGGGGPPPTPKVDVLASGSTGPYDYVVVKGSDASVLYQWLTDHAYVTPPKAKPILQAHIDKGDVFVAIKLSNGQGVQSIRPITLQMPNAEPCVPLRLTSIAAAEEMSVQVTIAGPGRAVVKNHLDVTVNLFRLKLVDQSGWEGAIPAVNYSQSQEPSNYKQVLAAAIDEAGGRALVTEASFAPGPATLVTPYALSSGASTLNNLAAATNWYDVAVSGFGPWPTNPEMADAVTLPGDMTTTFAGTAPLQAIAELRACGVYWNQIGPGGDAFGANLDQDCVLPGGKTYIKDKLKAMPADGAAMAKAIQTGIIDPLFDAWKLLNGAARLTRLAMRISPEEMDRDPVFAFNPALPEVAAQRKIPYTSVCPNGWPNQQHIRLSVDGLGSWVFKGNNTIDPRFINAPAALSMAVQEEQGQPVAIAPAQAEVVSAAIAGAVPGKPSLPKDLVLKPAPPWIPPPSDLLVTKLGPWPQPYNCTPKPGWADGKLPGAAVVEPGPDAGSVADAPALTDAPATTDTPAAGKDAAVEIEAKSGPVPGIDAAGGWADPGAAGEDAGIVADAAAAETKPATAAAAKSSGGCSATASPHGVNWAWIIGAAVWGLALWRRRATVAG